MNEKNFNLESALQRLAFVRPSENYSAAAIGIIRQNNNRYGFWRARFGIALSAALLLSVGMNLFQLSKPDSSLIENTLLTTSGELQATDVSAAGSIFRFLCLTKTTVAINNSLNLGELKGFGEWAYFQIPNNYQVTVSLLPLRDWNAIGQFEDGIISLQLDEGEVMELRGAGIGPSSIKHGGPFPVYGNIQQLSANNVPSGLASQDDSAADSRALLAPWAPEGTSDRGPLVISNILAGVDSELSPLTQKYFGALLRSGECG